MYDLKKKVRNKACVEASICEAYLVQEIATFCSYYFEPSVQTKLTRVPRNDDGGDVEHNGQLSVFCHPGRPFGSFEPRMMSDDEIKATHIYVLLNTEEVAPFVE